MNWDIDKGFVSILLIWSSVSTYRTSNSFYSTLSRTKWTSTSMCFVRTCATGFASMQVAPMLSHHITRHEKLGTCSSFSKPYSQVTIVTMWANALNSNSMLKLATTFCLHELHKIMLGQRKTQKPLAKLWSSTQLAQSAFEKLVRLN